MMEKQSRLDQLNHYLKTRNLFRVRELLIENLADFSEDKEFLMVCYNLAKKDLLVFQKHDHELLEPNLAKWSWEDYEKLTGRLKKNFSQMRYYLVMQLSVNFYKIRQEEQEKLLAIEIAEKENAEQMRQGKWRLKLYKRSKRGRSDKEKHTLLAIRTTLFLLVAMMVQLILEAN